MGWQISGTLHSYCRSLRCHGVSAQGAVDPLWQRSVKYALDKTLHIARLSPNNIPYRSRHKVGKPGINMKGWKWEAKKALGLENIHGVSMLISAADFSKRSPAPKASSAIVTVTLPNRLTRLPLAALSSVSLLSALSFARSVT